MTLRVRRVLETALDCDDLPASAAFYRRCSDVTPMLQTERLVAIDAGEGTVLLLFQRGNSGALETPGGLVPGHDGSAARCIWRSRSTRRICRPGKRASPTLASPIESRVRWERGGTSLYFRDPDGRSVELATPGIWPTY